MDAELVTAATPPAPVSALDSERDKYFFKQYLPTQTVLPGFHTPEQYIALPFADRQKLIDDMIARDAKAEKWAAADIRATRKGDTARYLYIDQPDRKAPKARSVLEAGGAFVDALVSGASQTAGKAVTAVGELTDSPRVAATGRGMTAYGAAIDKSRAGELPAIEAELARKKAAVEAAQQPDAGWIANTWRGITKGANALVADPLAAGGKLVADMAPAMAASKAAFTATPGNLWVKSGAAALAAAGVGAVQGQGAAVDVYDAARAVPLTEWRKSTPGFVEDERVMGAEAAIDKYAKLKAYNAEQAVKQGAIGAADAVISTIAGPVARTVGFGAAAPKAGALAALKRTGTSGAGEMASEAVSAGLGKINSNSVLGGIDNKTQLSDGLAEAIGESLPTAFAGGAGVHAGIGAGRRGMDALAARRAEAPQSQQSPPPQPTPVVGSATDAVVPTTDAPLPRTQEPPISTWAPATNLAPYETTFTEMMAALPPEDYAAGVAQLDELTRPGASEADILNAQRVITGTLNQGDLAGFRDDTPVTPEQQQAIRAMVSRVVPLPETPQAAPVVASQTPPTKTEPDIAAAKSLLDAAIADPSGPAARQVDAEMLLPAAQRDPAVQAAINANAYAAFSAVTAPQAPAGAASRAPRAEVAVPATFASLRDLAPFVGEMTPEQTTALGEALGDSTNPAGLTVDEVKSLGIVPKPYVSAAEPAPVVASKPARPVYDPDDNVLPPPRNIRKIKNPKQNSLADDQAQWVDTPVDAPTRAHVESGNVAQALASMAADPSLLAGQRAISAWLAPQVTRVTSEVVPGRIVGVDGNPTAVGEYNSLAAHMKISDEGGVSATTVIHEATHAVTEEVMLRPREELTEAQWRGKQELGAMYEHLKATKPAFVEWFNIPTLNEFVAQGVANGALQWEMMKTSWQASTMWQKFKTELRSLLGLDPLKMPDKMFESFVLAVNDIAQDARPLTEGGFSYATGKPKAPPPYDGKDFMVSRIDGAPKDVWSGSAYRDPETGTWIAEHHHPTAGTITHTLPDEPSAKAWLERFRDPTTKQYATVKVMQQGSDYEANIGAVQRGHTLGALGSAVQRVATALGASQESATKVLSYVKWGAPRMFYGRFASQDSVRDAVNAASLYMRLGEDAFTRAKAQGIAERTAPKIDGGVGYYAVEQDLKKTSDTLKTLTGDYNFGMGYAAAVSAAERNALYSAKFPTDTAGRPKDPDIAKFAYYTDANGALLPQAGADRLPLGAVRVSGVDAPQKYIAAFVAQMPAAAAPLADQFVENVRALNSFTIDMELAKGSISEKTAAEYRAAPTYLPLREIINANRANAGGVLGRSTSAVDPIAQLLAVSAARISNAHHAESVRELVFALQKNPNPNIASINASDVKLAPTTDSGDDARSTVKSVGVDWLGDRSLRVFAGDKEYRMTMANTPLGDELVASLKPGASDGVDLIARALLPAQALYQSLITGVAAPFHIGKNMSWDLVLTALNAQGAFGKNADGTFYITQGEAARLFADVAAQMATSRALLDAGKVKVGNALSSTGATSQTISPMRKFYDSVGGGITLAAQVGFADTSNMLDPAARNSLASKTFGGAIDGAQSLTKFMGGVSHTWSDAIRFSAFNGLLTMRNGGVPLRTEAEIAAFARANPDVVAKAIDGSKELLGNFEKVGSSIVTRAVLPYFSPAVIGTFRTFPQIFTSPYGQKGLMLLAATSAMIAASITGGEEDKDTDGKSKYMSKDQTYNTMRLGDAVAPIPHEVALVHAVGSMFGARMAGAKLDTSEMVGRLYKIAKGYAPFRTAPSSDEYGAPLWTGFGIAGLAYGVSPMNGVDQFGKPLNGVAKKTEDALANYDSPRAQDSALAEMLAAKTKMGDPGRWDLAMSGLGAINQYRKAYELGQVDGRGGLGAVIDVMKPWLVKPDNSFAVDGRYKALGADMRVAVSDVLRTGDDASETEVTKAAQNSADAQTFAAAEKEINALRKGIGTLSKQRGEARRLGYAAEYQALDAAYKAQAEQIAIAQGQVLNMLKP